MKDPNRPYDELAPSTIDQESYADTPSVARGLAEAFIGPAAVQRQQDVHEQTLRHMDEEHMLTLKGIDAATSIRQLASLAVAVVAVILLLVSPAIVLAVWRWLL